MISKGFPSYRSTEELEMALSEPDNSLRDFFKRNTGTVLILGVGGKVGPSLAMMAKRACEDVGAKNEIIGVSSFSTPGLREKLHEVGITTLQLDLLEPGIVEKLPIAENVIYMIGRKFGTAGSEGKTWATNAYLAGLMAQRFSQSRIVVFSSGNVYPLVPIQSGGATEDTNPEPLGEYAMSCLARERMFDYASEVWGTRAVHFRLNYAVELRYGVIVDIAMKILRDEPVDLTMGHFNAVWQRYVSSVALQSLELATSPPTVLNVTGPETVSVRWIASLFGELFDKRPVFVGEESANALLSNASKCHRLFGYPDFSIGRVVQMVADWLLHGGEIWQKPTHFETRDGKF